MSDIYVNPMAMRARLAAELAVLDLYGVVKTTAASLSDWVGVNGDSLPEPLVGEVNTSLVAMSAAAHCIGYRSADELSKRLDGGGWTVVGTYGSSTRTARSATAMGSPATASIQPKQLVCQITWR